MSIVNIVVGSLLLAFGRKIFWFFVAASGFYAGFEVASHYLNIKSNGVVLLIAVGVGLLGAVLAYFFQNLVIGAAGFLAGAFIAARLVSYLGTQVKGWEWLITLIGGIIGIILMYAIFEWALVLMSSMAGAILAVEGLKLAGLIGIIVGVVLFFAGMVFQNNLNRRSGSHRREKVTEGTRRQV